MINEGADIIDIGAVSSRPGADEISVEMERKRLFPVLEKIKDYFPHTPLSVDTYRYQIAEEAIKIGVDIINNINIEQDKEDMLRIIQKTKSPYILMHIIIFKRKYYFFLKNTSMNSIKLASLTLFLILVLDLEKH
jgi:dihydropteroate synthase